MPAAAGADQAPPYVEMVPQALLADGRRSKKERRTANALHAQWVAMGYEGGYTRLTDYIRHRRTTPGGVGVGDAYVPLSFAFGEAFQFDWSEEAPVTGGVYQRLLVAHLKLCASCAFWLAAYSGQGHEMLFDAHTRSFTALGGVARRGIYDSMKTTVDCVGRGKTREVDLRFTTMCAHDLFDPDFCKVASGCKKTVVEKNVQDSWRRIWLAARDRRFSGLDELNAWLGERCKAVERTASPRAPALQRGRGARTRAPAADAPAPYRSTAMCRSSAVSAAPAG